MTIQEILEAHQIGYVYADIHGLRKQGCTGCDFRIEGQASEIGNMHEIYRTHLAEVLDKHMQEREAKAWDRGHARALSAIIPTGNEPEPRNPYRKEPTNGR